MTTRALGTLLLLGMAAAPAQAGSDPCAYPYWPATPGLQREYTYLARTFASGGAPVETRARYTTIITERSGDHVTFRTDMHIENVPDPPVTVSVSRCTAKGPLAQPSGEGEMAVRYGGVEVPARLKTGTKWERDMILAQGSPRVFRTSYQALARETVTVPAGRFEAVKVAFEIRGRGQGAASFPVTSGTQWLARGVGMVRYVSRTVSEACGTQVTAETTHELLAVRESSASAHQTRHASARTIFEPAGQAYAFWNSGMFDTTPFTR